MSSSKHGLIVVPEWKSNKGGIQLLAQSLTHTLQKQSFAVTYMIGQTKDELSNTDRRELEKHSIVLIEPNLEEEVTENQPLSPIERLRNVREYYHPHGSIKMKRFSHAFVFSPATHNVVKYLFESGDSSDCQLCLINAADFSDTLSINQLIECARTSSCILSLGHRLYRKWNTELLTQGTDLQAKHHLYVPTFEDDVNKTSLTRPEKSDEDIERRIFIPIAEKSSRSDVFLAYVACVVQHINKQFNQSGLSRYKTYLKVQCTSDTLDKVFCEECSHEHGFEPVQIETKEQLLNIAETTIVLASGMFQTEGFSGLEFLMRGIPTFIPANTDVADVLKSLDEYNSDAFILDEQKDRNTIQAWGKKLTMAIRSYAESKRKAEELAASIKAHRVTKTSEERFDSFLKGYERLADIRSPLNISWQYDDLPSKHTLIGSGKYSKVYNVNNSIAMKVIDIQPIDINRNIAFQEVQILLKLFQAEKTHENIIRILGYHTGEREAYISMELANMDMNKLIKSDEYDLIAKQQNVLVDLSRQCYDGLQFLHSIYVVHQDVKPSNILFFGCKILKLADFGTARVKQRLDTETTSSVSGAGRCGTEYYQAPEIIIDGKSAQFYSDVWTTALVVVELLTRRPPWGLKHENRLGPSVMERLNKNQPQMLKHVARRDVRELLTEALIYDTEKRPSAEAMCERLRAAANKSDQAVLVRIPSSNERPLPQIPQTVTEEIEEQRVVECQSAEFQCTLNRSDIDVEWYIGDKPIKSSAKYDVSRDNLTRILKISDVDKRDAGVVCLKLKGARTALSSNRLVVVAVDISQPPEDVTVRIGKDATISCDIKPIDCPLKIRWFHNDTEITERNERDREKYGLYAHGSKRSLKVKNCNTSDDGIVQVKAGKAEGIARLEVKEKSNMARLLSLKKHIISRKLPPDAEPEENHAAAVASGYQGFPDSPANEDNIYEALPDGSDQSLFQEVHHGTINLIRLLSRKTDEEAVFDTWKAIWHGEPVIVKKFERDMFSEYTKEYTAMGKLKHENIVKLMGITGAGNPHYIVIEYMKDGDLLKYLKLNNDLSLRRRKDIARQVALAMHHMAKKGYIHGSLQAKHVYISGESVKVGHLNYARPVGEGTYILTQERQPPLKWVAPEVYIQDKHSIKSDVWSYGVVLYEIMTSGEEPYPDMDDSEIMLAIQKQHRTAKPDTCPSSAYEIMLQCWQEKPDDRLTFRYLSLLGVTSIEQDTASEGVISYQDETVTFADLKESCTLITKL